MTSQMNHKLDNRFPQEKDLKAKLSLTSDDYLAVLPTLKVNYLQRETGPKGYVLTALLDCILKLDPYHYNWFTVYIPERSQ